MHHLFEMTNQGQHRQYGFPDYPLILFAGLTNLEVGGMPVLIDKTKIGKQGHLLNISIDHGMECRAILDLRRLRIPIHKQVEMIEYETQSS